VAQKTAVHCDIRASFATAFRKWRVKRNIPLKKIAKDLGLSIATISKWELGKRFPTGYNLEMLADYTGVPVCQLFCRMADQCLPAGCPLAKPKKP
jgi:transcriptional regulator with XRE-family HTH domain